MYPQKYLPNEVLENIFSSSPLNAFDLIRIEKVCRKWRQVCQENRSLWKNSMYNIPITYKKDAWRYLQMFKICIKRSGEEGLEGLSVPVLSLYNDNGMLYELFDNFPSKSLQNLKIRVDRKPEYGLSIDNYVSVAALVANAIQKCSKLKCLYLELHEDLKEEEVENFIFTKSQPITNCQFQEFVLKGRRIDEMFCFEDMIKIFSKARVINCHHKSPLRFRYRNKRNNLLELPGKRVKRASMSGKNAFSLLSSAKDTLEQCSLKVDFFDVFQFNDPDQNKVGKGQKKLNLLLPKLVNLNLQFIVDPTSNQNILDFLQEKFTIVCPRIQSLTLAGPVTVPFCKSILTENIEKVRFLAPLSDCIKLLPDCKNLVRFHIDVRAYKYFTEMHNATYLRDEDELREACNNEMENVIPFLPIKQFIYEGGIDNSFEFISLMKLRSENPNAKELDYLTYISPDQLEKDQYLLLKSLYQNFKYRFDEGLSKFLDKS